ncbi:gamma-glutamyl-gamma-aminobutyrate hydrolase family protein [Candidatus Dojkabacteria bacterium]|nr:gamma-glutamyl-gamma-aminobutyrate hydrolase family protein [Candidatus Dojkabacteria bacterium]
MKRIGISMCLRHEHELQDCLNHSYVKFLRQLELVPILIPNRIDEPHSYADLLSIDYLLLSGGTDTTELVDGRSGIDISLRDKTERNLIGWACDKKIPIIGICRGFHLLNVYFGGNIHFDIYGQGIVTNSHVRCNHDVMLVNETVKSLLGVERLVVNSYHNNGITRDTLACSLLEIATSDGLVECAIHSELPICGIQWHPERDCESATINNLFFRKLLEGSFWRQK